MILIIIPINSSLTLTQHEAVLLYLFLKQQHLFTGSAVIYRDTGQSAAGPEEHVALSCLPHYPAVDINSKEPGSVSKQLTQRKDRCVWV